MSAVSGVKSKANCDAVNSGSFVSQVSNNCSLGAAPTTVKTSFNNGTKLNQSDAKLEPVSPAKITIVKQEAFATSNFQQQQQQQQQIQGQSLSDVQKVLKQEQELQKQLYSGANVAPGWLRVNHNNKVIYISPSGIGLASLKQVKDYLLTRGTCKCGLPFPLRVELFFNFSLEVSTVPLNTTPIDSIKFDPACQHRKKLTTNQAGNSSSSNTIDLVNNRSQHHQQQQQQRQTQKIIGTHKRLTGAAATAAAGECLLPSYVTSVNKIINQSSIRNNINTISSKSSSNTVMIVNSSNTTLSTNNPQIIQPQFITHHHQQQQQQQQNEMSTNVIMRIIKDESGNEIIASEISGKLPPWRKNSMQNQLVKNVGGGVNNASGSQQTQLISTTSGIPIFQINGQMIAIDQQNHQQFGNQTQQIQIIEQKTIDGEKTYIRRRAPPNFKEDPTGYLNQQTALLHNSITTLHSPDGSTTSTTSTSPVLQQHESSEILQQRAQQKQFIQQIVKGGGGGMIPTQVTTIGGQTVTHMSNGIVQIQNCDIKQQQQQQQQIKPIMIQEHIQLQQQQQQQQNKFIRTNPKGRPPKNAATIAKRLALSQESPVSSTSTAASSVMKITKSSTPDITSSSSSSHAEAVTETMVQSSSFDVGTEIVKIARNSTTTQELIRTSMTQVIAGKSNVTTTASAIRKPATTISMMKKPQTVLTQVKTTSVPNNNQLSGGAGIISTQNAANITGQHHHHLQLQQQQQHHQQQQQQVVMTSNGQQFIVMPSNMQQPQNIMLNNNNAIVQIQNSGTNTNQRLIQTTAGQGGNFIIQTSNGNVLTTANPLAAGNFIVNGQQLNQPLVLQNGQIIQNGGNLIASPKGNILVTGGTTSAGKTIITGNNQLASPLLGQQTVLLQPNSVMSQPTIIHPSSSFIQAATTAANNQQQQQHHHLQLQQQQQQKIIVTPEVKKKGRKRKIPLPDQVQSVTIQPTQQTAAAATTTTIQPSMIQMAAPQNFQLASPTGNQQIILQNPVSILGGGQHQLMATSTAQPLMALSADGNSLVQIQNPSFNNIITTPQGMMIRAPAATATQQQQPIQKTIITSNGQQYLVQGGQLNLMNQLQAFNPMSFVVQTAAGAQQNQQQIINPIVIHSPTQGQQIITQPHQILTHHSPGGQITTAQGTMLTAQQAQFITQNENKIQRKMMVQQKTQQQQQQHQQQQQQKFFSQMIKPPRSNSTATTTTTMYTTAASRNSMPTIVQSVMEQPEEEEEEEEEDSEEMIEQEEEAEEIGDEIEHEELELSFDDDDKPDMIEELHHGTSQQILHSSAMLNDGQCGIMNIDDITIEMDEINDLNEYLNAIDEEDNKMSQMGLSSLQQFANSPPDTTTHSPRSPNDNSGGVLHIGSERSNGSSEGNNMVSSSEADSNVVSPECHHHQIIDSAPSPSQYHHQINSGMQQPPIFKLPMEPRSSIKSPPSYNIMSANIFDANNRSPLMRPDSHGESASTDQLQQQPSQQLHLPTPPSMSDDYQNDGYDSSSSDENGKRGAEQQTQQQSSQQKSDFDLLKESPPVNTIRPPPVDMIKADDPPCRLSESPSPLNSLAIVESNNNTIGLLETSFKVGDLIWGAARGCDSLWPGKIVNGPEKEPTSSNCVWVKWFGGRQNTEMVQCNTLKSLSEGLEAHHAARKETRKGRKLNSHLERAIQKAMAELDKQSEAEHNTVKGNSSSNNAEKKTVTSSHRATKSRLIKIAPAPPERK